MTTGPPGATARLPLALMNQSSPLSAWTVCTAIWRSFSTTGSTLVD
ncbi:MULTISPECIES: hypothetical protein [Methylobacterium]